MATKAQKQEEATLSTGDKINQKMLSGGTLSQADFDFLRSIPTSWYSKLLADQEFAHLDEELAQQMINNSTQAIAAADESWRIEQAKHHEREQEQFTQHWNETDKAHRTQQQKQTTATTNAPQQVAEFGMELSVLDKQNQTLQKMADSNDPGHVTIAGTRLVVPTLTASVEVADASAILEKDKTILRNLVSEESTAAERQAATDDLTKVHNFMRTVFQTIKMVQEYAKVNSNVVFTDTLASQITKRYDAANPDTASIEKAREMMKSHRQALASKPPGMFSSSVNVEARKNAIRKSRQFENIHDELLHKVKKIK